jgi:hypothetical protein
VKYDRTESFRSDYRRLSAAEKQLFRDCVMVINKAFAKRSARQSSEWPAKLRIKRVRGASGIWEATWSFSGPDGRATFELRTDGDDPVLLWRRIGGHEIFRNP